MSRTFATPTRSLACLVLVAGVFAFAVVPMGEGHAASHAELMPRLAAGPHAYHLMASSPTALIEAFGTLNVSSSQAVTAVLMMGNGAPITVTGSLAAAGSAPISLTIQSAAGQWTATGSMADQQRMVGSIFSGAAPVGGFLLVPGTLRSLGTVEVFLKAGRDRGRALHGSLSFVVDLSGAVYGNMVNSDDGTSIAATGHAQGHQLQLVLPVASGNTLPHGGTFLVQGALVHRYAHWFYSGVATGPSDDDVGEFTALY